MHFSAFDTELTYEQSRCLVLDLVHRELSGFGDLAFAREILELIESERFEAIASLEIPYGDLSHDSASAVRQALAFFQKRTDLPVAIDRRAEAVKKFRAAEDSCRLTNDCLVARRQGRFFFAPEVESVLYRAQLKIAAILGDVPELARLKPRFGPGATTQVRKRDATPPVKLGSALACSDELLPILPLVLNELAGWVDQCTNWETVSDDEMVGSLTIEIHHGVVSFVPKSFKTDRAVVVEPMLNAMFQLGYGDYLASRLKKVGVDIRDQTRNQNLAKLGSLSGALATLDLSSASDTLSKELVYDLLPLDWAHALSRCRTGTVLLDGELLQQSKFSSMGNGYTFPLETLIFFALAHASATEVGESTESVSVYGDDIIVPTPAYDLLVRTLKAVGFMPNADKSFAAGPFRESCGKDYHFGMDIRPFYFKGSVSCDQLFALHNFYARKGELQKAAGVRDYIPSYLRIYGPDGFGDGHLVGVHPVVQKRAHLERGYGGYVFDTFTMEKRSRVIHKLKGSAVVLPAYSVYVGSPSESVWEDVGRKSNYLGLRTYHLNLRDSNSGYRASRHGDLEVTLPGSRGVKRISIYTLG